MLIFTLLLLVACFLLAVPLVLIILIEVYDPDKHIHRMTKIRINRKQQRKPQ